MEEWEARKEGNHSSVTTLFPSFLVLSSYPFQLEVPHINYVSELIEEVDLDTFLKEDQATLTRRGKQSVARVVGKLRDYLQHECGEGEVLPDNVFRDVMLQVHVHTFSLSTLFTNPFLILFKPESALFTYFNISFFFFSGNQADSDWHQAAGGGQLMPVRGLDLPPLCHGWS